MTRALAAAALVIIATLARAEAPLGNGLRVILSPDPAATDVVVHIRYAGGAAAESAVQAGFTHLVEKLLALGTVHRKPGEHDTLIEEARGWTTSVTTLDELIVTTQVPAGALERVLWLEAERMAGLADGITQNGLDQARAAIDAEYRGAYVEQPYAGAARELRNALWPVGHPYRNDVLGDGTALGKATLEQVRAFARERIRPARATIVIAGNFDPARVQPLVRRYFGWIPDGKPVAPPPRAIVTAGSQAVEREITAPVEEVVVAYRVPSLTAEHEVFANMLASIGSGLHQALVVERKWASEIRVEITEHALRVHVIPTPGAPLVRIAMTTRSETEALARMPIAALVETSRRAVEIQRLTAQETLASRARMLAQEAQPISAITAVTAKRIQTALAGWVVFENSTTVIAQGGVP